MKRLCLSLRYAIMHLTLRIQNDLYEHTIKIMMTYRWKMKNLLRNTINPFYECKNLVILCNYSRVMYIYRCISHKLIVSCLFKYFEHLNGTRSTG